MMIDIRFMESERTCQAVEYGELELAVVSLPLAQTETLNTETIWREPYAHAQWSA